MVHETPTITDRVAIIVANVLADTGVVVRPDNLRPTHILFDLGADALDVMEIVTRAEEEFGVEIDDETIGTGSTFGEIVAAVAGKRE